MGCLVTFAEYYSDRFAVLVTCFPFPVSEVMEGHTSYINHLVFEPTEGKQIASVSDDHTCRCVFCNQTLKEQLLQLFI